MRLAWSPDLLCVAWDVPRSRINGIKATSSSQPEKQPRKTSIHAFPPPLSRPSYPPVPESSPRVTWTASTAITRNIVRELCIRNIFVLRCSVCSPIGSSHFLFISPSGSYLLSDQTSPWMSLDAKRQMDWIWKTFFFLNTKASIPLVPSTLNVAAVKANAALAVFV